MKHEHMTRSDTSYVWCVSSRHVSIYFSVSEPELPTSFASCVVHVLAGSRYEIELAAHFAVVYTTLTFRALNLNPQDTVESQTASDKLKP